MPLRDILSGRRSALTDTPARWWREAFVPRLLVMRYLPVAGPRLMSALLAVNVVLGLLPVAFVLLMSLLVGRVPMR